MHGSGPRQHEQLTQKVTLGSLEKVGRVRGVNLETQPNPSPPRLVMQTETANSLAKNVCADRCFRLWCNLQVSENNIAELANTPASAQG